MFDIGWSEMMLIVIVMIIVIGPKDLPRVMHTAGKWIGQARAVARHFQESLEQMVEESGLDDARKEIEKVSRMDVGAEIDKTIDPSGELREGMTIESPEARAARERAAVAEEAVTSEMPREEAAAPGEGSATPKPKRKRAPRKKPAAGTAPKKKAAPAPETANTETPDTKTPGDGTP